MLDDGDIALDDLFGHIVGGAVTLHGVKFWLCTYLVDGSIKQISLGRADFTDSPVIAADIILGGELPVFIGGIGVNKLSVIVDAVDRTCKGRIALCRACLAVALGDGDIKLL